MLSAEFDRRLMEHAVDRIRSAGPRGLSGDELAATLRSEGWRFSGRRLRELLRRLEEEGRIARRLERGSRERPRLRYIPPEVSPPSPSGEVALRLVPRDCLEKPGPPWERCGRMATTWPEGVPPEDAVRALQETAPVLAGEDPRGLLLEMARWMVERLRAAHQELLAALRGQGGRTEERIERLEAWTCFARRFFGERVGLSLSPDEGNGKWAMRIDMDRCRWRDPEIPDGELFALREEQAREELARQVLGKSVVEIRASGDPLAEAVVTTDTSVAILAIQPPEGGAMIPPEDVEVFFPATALQIRSPDGPPLLMLDVDIHSDVFRRVNGREAFRHGLAFLPEAVRWMGWDEERLRHARCAALDLRQRWRDVEEMSGCVPRGRAAAVRLLFRNGSPLPSGFSIERYEAPTPCGDLARNQIRAAAHAPHAARLHGCVYVGVIREPEMPFLASLAFWHAAVRRGDPYVPEDWILQPPLEDSLAAFVLLSAAARSRGAADGDLALSFRVLRRFSDVAGLPDLLLEKEGGWCRMRPDRPGDWRRYFDQHSERQARRHRDGDMAVFPLPRNEYNPLVELCERLAVLKLFLLRAGEDTRPVRLPRYEVMVDVADPAWPLENQWRHALERLRAWAADPEAFALEKGSDFPRRLPRVAVEARQAASGAAKALRMEMESRLRKIARGIVRMMGQGGSAG